jgi:importin subunit beta-1
VAQVLQQAASIPMTPDITYEMLDYVISLREGIMDAWDGAIVAMKSSGKSKFAMFLHYAREFPQVNADMR